MIRYEAGRQQAKKIENTMHAWLLRENGGRNGKI